MNTERYKKYVADKLATINELSDYIREASIIFNSYENDAIWDVHFLIETESYEKTFAPKNGRHFVVDDHDNSPPVFTKVRSLNWFIEDFAKRLPIALWIAQNSSVINDNGKIREIIKENEIKFKSSLGTIARKKFLEMRSDRHNLRYSIIKSSNTATTLLKANIAKLCLELSLLAEGKSYPFRVLLPDYARKNSSIGDKLCELIDEFLLDVDAKSSIAKTEELIALVSRAIKQANILPNELLEKWWLNLD